MVILIVLLIVPIVTQLVTYQILKRQHFGRGAYPDFANAAHFYDDYKDRYAREGVSFLSGKNRLQGYVYGTVSLDDKQLAYLATILQLYEQQQSMYDNKTRRCDDRIVSIHQPHVRPIVRGKATAGTEFGAKFTATVVDGYAEVCNLSWDAYNESQDLIDACEQYKARHGHFPKRILADKIFRTRKNLQYCKDRDIHLNGPPLGRPPKDPQVLNEQLRLEREESGERNAIEGKFGEGKRRFSLGLVMTKLKATSETQIHLSFLVMNLQKILRDLFVSLFIDLFPANHRWFSPAVV